MATVARRPSRGRLRPMRNRADAREFVLDQLSDVRHLRAQAMFGGIGLYADELFFGILAADVLYFKVDDTNRAAYEAAGSAPFAPYQDDPMTMPYFTVPVEVLESRPLLVEWAHRSIAVARASARSSRRAPTVERARASTSTTGVVPATAGRQAGRTARKTTGRTPR